MLIFILKNYWYDKIASGEKEIEYREVKPYWSKRLEKILPPDFLYASVKAFADAGHEIAGIEFGEDIRPLCLLRRGFTRKRMTAKIKEIRIVNGANTDLKINAPVYAIHLCDVKRVKNDRRKNHHSTTNEE